MEQQMKLTQKEVERHFRNESFDLVFATEAQIDKLCSTWGDDTPRLHWDMVQEDMYYMMKSVVDEVFSK